MIRPPLTEREILVAEIAAAKNAVILRRVIMSVAAVAAIVIIGLVVGWTVVRQESVHRTDQINANRLQVLADGCEETNSRNRGTLAKLDEVAPARPTPRELQRIQSTKLLIAALVPFRPDCERYARDRLDVP